VGEEAPKGPLELAFLAQGGKVEEGLEGQAGSEVAQPLADEAELRIDRIGPEDRQRGGHGVGRIEGSPGIEAREPCLDRKRVARAKEDGKGAGRRKGHRGGAVEGEGTRQGSGLDKDGRDPRVEAGEGKEGQGRQGCGEGRCEGLLFSARGELPGGSLRLLVVPLEAGPRLEDDVVIGGAGPRRPCPGSEDGFWAAPWEERSLSAADSLALLELLRAPEGATLNLPHGLLAQASKRFVHLVRMADGSPVVPTAPPPPVSLTGQRGSISFGNQPFRLSAYNPDTDPTPDGILAVVVPNDVLARAVLRVPSAGDRIRPFGAAGGKAFRRYLTDRKLDPPFRPGIPVLCDGAEVLWAVGIGCSEWTRVTQTPSTRVEVQNEPIWTVKTAR